MWLDSEAWSHLTSCGPNGVTRGGGMPQAAGSYIGKLRKEGLVMMIGDGGHQLTRKGMEALEHV